jgi:hypothetical protein
MEASVIQLDQIRQSFLSNESYLEYLDGEYPVDCKCPMCGKTHRVNLFWTGRGVPRKYCPQCKGGVGRGYGHNSMLTFDSPEELDDVRLRA